MFRLLTYQHRRRNVRLDTLVRLRWLAVIGQLAAILMVHFGLEFEVPIWPCLAVIAMPVFLNVALRLGFPQTLWLEPDRAAWLLGFDIAQLAALLFLTGGLENPFSYLLLGPVLISATALPPRMTLLLGAFAMVCATVLIFFHYPLPWDSDDPLDLPDIYTVGRLALDPARHRLSSASTRGRSPRRRASSPMRWLRPSWCWRASSTCRSSTVWPPPPRTSSARRSPPSRWWRARLERALVPNSPLADDIKLLREQTQRCRDILSKITELPPARPVRSHAALGPDRGGGGAASQFRRLDRRDAAARPQHASRSATAIRRSVYGLGNLLENAVDFANKRVEVAGALGRRRGQRHDQRRRPRLCAGGHRPRRRALRHAPPARTGCRTDDDEAAFGLGLGFFIAKTLLERSGAKLSVENRRRRRMAPSSAGLEPRRFRTAAAALALEPEARHLVDAWPGNRRSREAIRCGCAPWPRQVAWTMPPACQVERFPVE